MPAERFYIEGELQGTLVLKGIEHHHLANVMRMRSGEEVELVNGQGALAQAEIVNVGKKETTLHVQKVTNTPIPPPFLSLAVPLMRPAKLELVIEKCTELGADRFFLYSADHSEKEGLSEHQEERLRTIAIAAMKQCGRLDLPSIAKCSSLQEVLKVPSGWIAYGDPEAKELAARRGEPTIFITGPESGFSEKEQKLLQRQAHAVRLRRTNTVLRAETAPLVAAVLFEKAPL